jgi:hypothetical protein
MADREDPRDGQEASHDPSLQEEWDREGRRTINESALRGRPDWVKAIGDEDEDPERIDQNLQAYGWDLLGEDDFVSDPTGESDSPTWVDDDYDDENLPHIKDEDEPPDEDRFYSD